MTKLQLHYFDPSIFAEDILAGSQVSKFSRQ